MFLSTEGFPQAHHILGIINTTNYLTMSTEVVNSLESMDRLFSDVQEKLKRRTNEKGADGAVGARFTTDVANIQIVPEFLVPIAYGTTIQFVR